MTRPPQFLRLAYSRFALALIDYIAVVANGDISFP
jgi:hypothetical protein